MIPLNMVSGNKTDQLFLPFKRFFFSFFFLFCTLQYEGCVGRKDEFGKVATDPGQKKKSSKSESDLSNVKGW